MAARASRPTNAAATPFRACPGLVRVGHFTFPPTHVQSPGQGWEDFTVPEPPKVIELATREALPAAPPLRGQVVDESGQAIPRRIDSGARGCSPAGTGSSSGSINDQRRRQGRRSSSKGSDPTRPSRSPRSIGTARARAPSRCGPARRDPVTVAIAPMPRSRRGRSRARAGRDADGRHSRQGAVPHPSRQLLGLPRTGPVRRQPRDQDRPRTARSRRRKSWSESRASSGSRSSPRVFFPAGPLGLPYPRETCSRFRT